MEIPKDHETSACPVDGAAAPRWTVVGGFSIHRCPTCGLGFVSPIPEVPEGIYGEDYFFGSTKGFGYVDYDSDKQAMAGELKRTCAELAERLSRKGSLLDVGAATGFFVELAGKEGWDAEGIELSGAAVRSGTEKGRKLTAGTIGAMPGTGRFDAVTFLDVLEHVPDPKAALADAHRLLNADGVVLVNVPDFGSVFARIMGHNWQAVIPPEHLWFFTRKSLRMALESAGFTDIRFRKPLKTFRVRYIVSVLARKYPWPPLRRIQSWIERSMVGKLMLPVPIFDNLLATAKKASGTPHPASTARPKDLKRYILALLAIVTALFLTPIFRVRMIAGDAWRGVVPSVVDDDVYYYARIHEIIDGHPFIGNPYFFEHRDDPSPAFIGADWLASIPFFFMPFVFGVAWNLLFWPIVSALLAYLLIHRAGARGWWAVVGAVMFILVSYEVFIRPTSMQVVLPSLLIFWLALQTWIRSPMSRRSTAWLAAATALQFYVYSYLWLVAGGTCIAALFILTIRRRWAAARRLFLAGCGSLVLASPALWLMVLQFRNPWYGETMARIGLVQTHIPPLLAFELAAWIAVVCTLWILMRPPNEQGPGRNTSDLFVFAGAGIAVAMLSPILTGRELATANHLLRFAIPWGTCVLTVCLARIAADRTRWNGMGAMRRCIAVLLAAVSLYYPLSVSWAVPRFALMASAQTERDIRDVQAYASPSAWLNAQGGGPAVVLADPAFMSYVPILTKDYVVFNMFGILHLMSDREAEDRFLVSQAFVPPTAASLAAQYRTYAGAGSASDQPNTRVREVRTCRLLRLDAFGMDCGSAPASVTDWKGSAYFDGLAHDFQADVAADIPAALRRSNVSYVVRDRVNDPDWDVAGRLPSSTKAYDDGRFEIYQLGR